MEKLSMCRICLVENVRMCVVTNKSLQEMYEKLTDVPFVTEDRKSMLACLFCCTRLKQCCQLQRQCVQAEEMLAQILSADYEQKPLTDRGHLEFVGRFIVTPTENISIVDDCRIGSDAIKQELPAVCEEQGDVELQPAQPSEELVPENIDNSHSGEKDHNSESESEEDQLVMLIKIEEEENELSENLRVRETEKLELENLDKSNPGVEKIPAHDSKQDSEDNLRLKEKTAEVEEGLLVPKRKRRARVIHKLELENLDKSYPGVGKIPAHESNSDSEDNVPLKEITTVVEKGLEVPKRKRRVCVIKKLVPENIDNSHSGIKDHNSESESEEDQLVMLIKIEEEEHELSENLRVRETERAAVVMKPTLKRKLGDTIPAKQTINLLTDSKNIRTIETNTPESVAKIKEPITTTSQSSLSQSSNLKQHKLIHTGEKSFKCDVCQRSFGQSSNLKQHIRMHTGEKPYKCHVCQHSFGQSSHLKQHIRIHTGEKPYKCDVCQHSFRFKGNLKVHFRKHSGENPFKCDVCPRAFAQSSNLKQHIRVHTSENLYKCNVCQRSYKYKNNLIEHLRKHSDENPFKFDISQRSFGQSSHLDQYNRVHTGERPYKCDVCQRSYKYRNNLIEHQRSICQRSFVQSSHLKQHIRVYSGKRPYKCDVCRRSFSQSSHLKQHIRVHTDEKPE